MKTCQVIIEVPCGKPHSGRGMCREHYMMWYTYETPTGRRHAASSGRVKHPLYGVYHGMHQRCYYKKHVAYKNYGKRGIKVCDRWNKAIVGWQGFDNFVHDMGERPRGYSLDRINNNGNYTPDNCRWVPVRVQATNRHTGNEIPGVCWDKSRSKWTAYLIVDKKPVLRKRFDTREEAISARKQAERLFYV